MGGAARAGPAVKVVAMIAVLLGWWITFLGVAVGEYRTAAGASLLALAAWRIAPR